LTVIHSLAPCPFDTLVSASRTDVRLTVIDGRPALGEPELAPAFHAAGVGTPAGVGTLPARVDGSARIVAKWIGAHVARMQLQEPGFEVHPGRRSLGGGG
jgi:hypothetical protein